MKPGVCMCSPQTPPPKGDRAISGAYLWIPMCQSDSCHVACMWLSCDNALQLIFAAPVWPCQNNALSWRSHDMLHPVCPQKQSMCLLWGCDYNTVWRVIFVGSNFRWKSEKVLKINFCAFKLHDSNQCRGVALLHKRWCNRYTLSRPSLLLRHTYRDLDKKYEIEEY